MVQDDAALIEVPLELLPLRVRCVLLGAIAPLLALLLGSIAPLRSLPPLPDPSPPPPPLARSGLLAAAHLPPVLTGHVSSFLPY